MGRRGGVFPLLTARDDAVIVYHYFSRGDGCVGVSNSTVYSGRCFKELYFNLINWQIRR